MRCRLRTIVPGIALATAVVAPFAASARASDATGSGPTAQAMAVLDAFMQAFNARDVDAVEAQLHFPHYRFADGEVEVIERPGTQADLFERFVAATPGWHHSAWESREVVQSGPDKLHVATRFVRQRADGSRIAGFDSLYILTFEDGRWGIKARSSFAP